MSTPSSILLILLIKKKKPYNKFSFELFKVNTQYTYGMSVCKNIYTHHTQCHWKFQCRRGTSKAKTLKGKYELNWNFQRSRVGRRRGSVKKKFYEGKMIIFQSNALTLTTPNGLVWQNLDTQGKVQVWPM